jgi:hypothetical protein
MHNLHPLLLLLAIIGSIIYPISVFFSRKRIYAPWAKVVSLLVCIVGLGWGAGGFIFDHLEVSRSTHVVLQDLRRYCGGIGVWLLLCIIIAKPYKTVISEKQNH